MPIWRNWNVLKLAHIDFFWHLIDLGRLVYRLYEMLLLGNARSLHYFCALKTNLFLQRKLYLNYFYFFIAWENLEDFFVKWAWTAWPTRYHIVSLYLVFTMKSCLVIIVVLAENLALNDGGLHFKIFVKFKRFWWILALIFWCSVGNSQFYKR